MRKVLIAFFVVIFFQTMVYSQNGFNIVFHVNPTLNLLKYEGYNSHRSSFIDDASMLLDNRAKASIGYGVSLNIMYAMHLDLIFDSYNFKIPLVKSTNSQSYDKVKIRNFISHVGMNIGREFAFTPYIVWGLTKVKLDSYSMYPGNCKIYSGSWSGVTLTYGFGAKVSYFAMEPFFCSLGFSKMYPWMAGDLFDPSYMHGGETSTMAFNTAVKQTNFQLSLGLIFGDTDK